MQSDGASLGYENLMLGPGAGGADSGQIGRRSNIVRILPATLALGAAGAGDLDSRVVGQLHLRNDKQSGKFARVFGKERRGRQAQAGFERRPDGLLLARAVEALQYRI